MPEELEVGDRVIIVVDDELGGQSGEIIVVDGDLFLIKLDTPAELWFGSEELERE